MKSGRPTFAFIDDEALAHNFGEAKRLAGAREVIAVVKADAYGHGAVPVARAPRGERLPQLRGRDGRGGRASSALPGSRTRCSCSAAYTTRGEADEAVALGATPVVQHAGHVALLRKAAAERSSKVAVQVEVDTGMARMGISPEDAPSLIEGIARDARLRARRPLLALRVRG